MKKLPSVVALLCGFSWVVSIPSVAGEMNETVHFDATRRSDGKIEVKFVIAKAADGSGKFAPVRGYSIVPDVPQKQCGIQNTADYKLSKEHLASPVYDFADKSRQLPLEKLPMFFATVTSAELARAGLAKTGDDALPYHTCTRVLWTQLLGLQRK
ncbi:MAG: hypothetical protein V4724_14480 [Pseudomonadota bacterium]